MTSDEWHDSQDAQDYGLAILSGDRVRLRELRDGDVDQLVSWWNIPEWAALQQKSVKPRPEQPLKEMFRTWSENKPASADVGFSIVRRVDDVLIGHATCSAPLPPCARRDSPSCWGRISSARASDPKPSG